MIQRSIEAVGSVGQDGILPPIVNRRAGAEPRGRPHSAAGCLTANLPRNGRARVFGDVARQDNGA
jgi:hypothetical protein